MVIAVLGVGEGVVVNSKKIKWSKGCLLYVGLCHGIVQHTSVIIMVDMFLSNSCQKSSIGRFLYIRMGRDLVQHSSGIVLDIFLSNSCQNWSDGCLLYVLMDHASVQYSSGTILDTFLSDPR